MGYDTDTLNDQAKNVAKGDEPGHPFRGNQYVSGESNSVVHEREPGTHGFAESRVVTTTEDLRHVGHQARQTLETRLAMGKNLRDALSGAIGGMVFNHGVGKTIHFFGLKEVGGARNLFNQFDTYQRTQSYGKALVARLSDKEVKDMVSRLRAYKPFD